MPGSLAREQSGQATVANTFTAGVDVGGSKLHGVLLDSTGTVRSRLRHQMPTGGGNTIVEAAILALLDELLAQAAALDCYPAAIGLGAPGFVDSGEGTIVDASNLHVRRLNIGRAVTLRYGLPAQIVHDVKAAAFGESIYGSGRGVDFWAYLNLGTGVAAAFLLAGRLYEGAAGRAGEIGHVQIDPHGPLCTCGRRGCLEMYASGPALERSARLAATRHPSSFLATSAGGGEAPIRAHLVAKAAQAGDGTAIQVIEQAAEYVGQAIAALVNVLDLQRVVLGGGLLQMGSLLSDPIRRSADRCLLADYRGQVDIVEAMLGNDAGAVGAAALVQNAIQTSLT